jgi:hypothetical protein
MGRRKPYTEIGIRRVPCMRCGKPSLQQWQVCSLNNKYHGLCGECDIKLNRIVLRFMRLKPEKVFCLMVGYRERLIRCAKKKGRVISRHKSHRAAVKVHRAIQANKKR